jgi:hypothetical protein
MFQVFDIKDNNSSGSGVRISCTEKHVPDMYKLIKYFEELGCVVQEWDIKSGSDFGDNAKDLIVTSEDGRPLRAIFERFCEYVELRGAFGKYENTQELDFIEKQKSNLFDR